MGGIVVSGIGFDVGQGKLVVFRADRRDLPHVTVSWGNRSGEVDVHITPQNPRGANARESVFRMQQSDLIGSARKLALMALEPVGKTPVRVVSGIGAAWLREHGYVLVALKDLSIVEWLRGALPRKRGKYRLDPVKFRQLPQPAVFSPTARNFDKLGREGCFHQAVCTKGPERGTALLLVRLDVVPPWWVAVDIQDGLELIQRVKDSRLLSRWFTTLAPGTWERVHSALRLGELGF